MDVATNPLTEEQIVKFKGMSLYWQEVRLRDNPGNILNDEAAMVMRMIKPYQLLGLIELAIEQAVSQ